MGAKAEQQPGGIDDDGIVRRSVSFEVRSVNEEERSLEVVASTDSLDSHGDVVDQDFDLKRYKKNPVVLWLHNAFGWFDGSRAEDFLPIGRAENVKVVDGQLSAKIFFVTGDASEEPMVDKIWRRVSQKVLRAVSIGFRPGKVTREEHGESVVYRLSDNELFEISVVPIPSNPDAVAKAATAERDQLRRLFAAQHPEEEDTMSAEKIKELEASLSAAETKAKSEEAKAAALEIQVKEANEKATAAEKALADETKRADEALKATATLEVKTLVGKKITPSEEAEFLELRLSNPDLFRKMVEKRTDLAPLSEQVTPGLKPNETTKGKGSARLAERAQEGAR